MTKALYILLAWLLGIISQPIVSRINKYYKRNDLKKVIFYDLKNLEYRLAANYHKINIHLGNIDKPKLKWIKTIYEKNIEDCPKMLIEIINKKLQFSESEFDKFTNQSKAKENINLDLKKFSLSFTESILERLSIFDAKFQKDILDIRDHNNILNEEIENAKFYFRLTFDPSCMDINNEIIKLNLEKSYNSIQERCRIIIDKIEKILKN